MDRVMLMVEYRKFYLVDGTYILFTSNNRKNNLVLVERKQGNSTIEYENIAGAVSDASFCRDYVKKYLGTLQGVIDEDYILSFSYDRKFCMDVTATYLGNNQVMLRASDRQMYLSCSMNAVETIKKKAIELYCFVIGVAN